MMLIHCRSEKTCQHLTTTTEVSDCNVNVHGDNKHIHVPQITHHDCFS